MAETTLWIKPNGTEIQLNTRPETEAHAASLGWKKKPAAKTKAKAKQ